MDKSVEDAKRAQAAKDRAKSYTQPNMISEDDVPEAGPRDESEWTDIVGQRIEQAIREGAFDNLPGRGQPLNFNKNPFVPDHQQMAFKLLENNDLKPAWISERNAVLAEVTQFRSTLASAARRHQREYSHSTDPAVRERLASNWAGQIACWTDEMADLNSRIETLNLQQPVAQLEIFKLRLDVELARAGASRRLE
jgi:DnaJ family protein C protein 28